RLRKAPKDRLRDDALLGRLATGAEQRREREALLPALRRDCRRDRAPLFHPAVRERDLLAERADVDEASVARRREAGRTLPHQQSPLADGAGARLGLARDAHGAQKGTRLEPPARMAPAARITFGTKLAHTRALFAARISSGWWDGVPRKSL